MSIFIFEDDVIQAQSLRKMVEEICQHHEIQYDFIEVTSKSKKIIKKIPQTTYLPIYFLDIEIKQEERKGLRVAQEIRKYDPEGIIVFVTTHSEFAPISYQYMVSAYTFIDKSYTYEKRYHLLEQCLHHYAARNASHTPVDDFILENAHATVKVPFSKMEYIKTDEAHRLVLVTTDQLLQFYGTLKEIEGMDNRLLRCHQSYIVNTNQVATYDKRERVLILKSDKRIPVSRRLSQKVGRKIRGEH